MISCRYTRACRRGCGSSPGRERPGVGPGSKPLVGDRLLSSYPWIYELGLSPPLLEMVECYLGQPAVYLGAIFKREVADGAARGARQWHRDVEDRRMLRLLIYLSDVRCGGGPFEYVAAAESRRAARSGRYRSGYRSDKQMARISPPETWEQVYGDLGDVIVFDGALVFHRAQRPEVCNRLSITLAYASSKPLELRLDARLSKACAPGDLHAASRKQIRRFARPDRSEN